MKSIKKLFKRLDLVSVSVVKSVPSGKVNRHSPPEVFESEESLSAHCFYIDRSFVGEIESFGEKKVKFIEVGKFEMTYPLDYIHSKECIVAFADGGIGYIIKKISK